MKIHFAPDYDQKTPYDERIDQCWRNIARMVDAPLENLSVPSPQCLWWSNLWRLQRLLGKRYHRSLPIVTAAVLQHQSLQARRMQSLFRIITQAQQSSPTIDHDIEKLWDMVHASDLKRGWRLFKNICTKLFHDTAVALTSNILVKWMLICRYFFDCEHQQQLVQRWDILDRQRRDLSCYFRE